MRRLEYVRARWYQAGGPGWLSKDPIGLRGGDVNLYRYVRNRPLVLTDPSGLEGQVRLDPGLTDLSYACAHHPGGPCAFAKSRGDDRGDGGGVVCCNGRKHVCDWQPRGIRTGLRDCSAVHERDHLDDIVCPRSGYWRSPFRPGKDRDTEECHAYTIEIQCLIDKKRKEGGGLTGASKVWCYNDYDDRIRQLCRTMQERYHCPSRPAICGRDYGSPPPQGGTGSAQLTP
jgi:hypothetical protein